MKMQENDDDSYSLMRGRIINAAINVERRIDVILVSYFRPKLKEEFYQMILLEMPWEKKNKLINKISKIRSINISVLSKRLENIKTKRNIAAHWKQLSSFTGIKINKKKFGLVKSGKEMLVLSLKDIEKYEEECNLVEVLLNNIVEKITK